MFFRRIFAVPNEGYRGVAQLASASGLGPEGPVFESQYPDKRAVDFQLLFFLFTFDAALLPPPERVFVGGMQEKDAKR